MSHHSGNYGGQCPSNPPTERDKRIACSAGAAFLFVIVFLLKDIAPWIACLLLVLAIGMAGKAWL